MSAIDHNHRAHNHRVTKLLILGGTSFVGRALAEEATRRGHQVATFNRGLTATDVPGVEAIRGDRSNDNGLKDLAGREFEAVLDVSGLVPAHVLRTARFLHGTVPFYAYVSSTAVYRDWSVLPWHENSPVHDGMPDEDGDPAELHLLGPRKAGCERAVREVYGDANSLTLRPGLIVGPFDNVGLLPWWLTRIHGGKQVLAPGGPDLPVQLIDVRDVAAFALDRVEARLAGVFNLVPDKPITTFGAWLDECIVATGSDAELVWLDDQFLLDNGVQPWTELPLWLPAAPTDPRASAPASGAAARGAGLECRSVRESVLSTWEWLREGNTVRRAPGAPTLGLVPDKEQQLLAAWAELARRC